MNILPNHENEGNFNQIIFMLHQNLPKRRKFFSTIRKSKDFEIPIPTNNFTRHSHHSEKWDCFPLGLLKSDGAWDLFRSILQSEKTRAIWAPQQLFPAVVYTSAPKLEMPLFQKKTIHPSNFLHQATTIVSVFTTEVLNFCILARAVLFFFFF